MILRREGNEPYWKRWFAWYPVWTSDVIDGYASSSLVWFQFVDRHYDSEYGLTDYKLIK